MSLKNCLAYQGKKNIASFRKLLLFLAKEVHQVSSVNLWLQLKYFSVGQDSSKFVKNTLQQVMFSTRFSEMKQHCL